MTKDETKYQVPAERLTVTCECGAVHVFTLGWHEVGRAKCGHSFWALQPRKNGPLQIFLWPGPPMTKWEQRDAALKEKGQTV